jgi:membrane protein insertase Oxa1/YidC/SpoIIIJ
MVTGLDMGGAFWFVDLTAPDPYLVFPLVTGASTLLNIEACAAIVVACCV